MGFEGRKIKKNVVYFSLNERKGLEYGKNNCDSQSEGRGWKNNNGN